MSYIYRALGLDLTAPFACPGFASATGPATGRTVAFVLGPVPSRLDHPTTKRPLFQADDSGLALHIVPGIARYLIEGRSRVTIDVEPGVALGRAVRFLKGTPMAWLCRQWGLVPLRAICLSREGRALLLAGNPGAGKTTLALALAAHGFSLMSDSLCALEARDGAPQLIWPAFPEARAWRDSLTALGRETPGPPGPGGRYELAAGSWFDPEPRPAMAAVWLEAASGGVAEQITRQHGAAAFEAIMNMQSLAGSLQSTASAAGSARATAHLAARIPVYRTWYPTGLERIASLADWLIEGIGLTRPAKADAPSIAACA